VSSLEFADDVHSRMARVELLQGLDVEPDDRRALYDRFGGDEDPWSTKARAAYEAMGAAGGFVASVGDLLAAELDVWEHADVYAAIGGFDSGDITDGLGTWWAPTAAWYLFGREITAGAEGFDQMASALLEAGASTLSSFYSTVARGGLRVVEGRWWPWQATIRRELALATGILVQRSQLFLAGPREDGRYLPNTLDDLDLVAAARLRRPGVREREAPAGSSR
jgi:hypothetical protein